jgi:hypothetical protein
MAIPVNECGILTGEEMGGDLALQVCFVTCNEWNYWESCMDHDQQPVRPDSVEDFVRIGTRVNIAVHLYV